jgi:hypothetical protein
MEKNRKALKDYVLRDSHTNKVLKPEDLGLYPDEYTFVVLASLGSTRTPEGRVDCFGRSVYASK